MTDQDLARVQTHRARLYPQSRSWSDDQLAIVRRIIERMNASVENVLAALDAYAEQSAFAPAPSELRAQLAKVMPASAISRQRTTQTAEDIDRVKFAEANPGEAATILAMSDVGIRRFRARWEFNRALDIYGPKSATTAVRYAEWLEAESREDGRGFASATPETRQALADAIERGEVVVPEHHRKRQVAEAAR